jgi:hypothetical protein
MNPGITPTTWPPASFTELRERAHHPDVAAAVDKAPAVRDHRAADLLGGRIIPGFEVVGRAAVDAEELCHGVCACHDGASAPGNEPKFLSPQAPYRGRLAPSPTGYLHLGHARTFWIAARRARRSGGALVLRNDDLDATRYRMDFAGAMIADLRWLGLSWDEGPDVGGPHAPYSQSERRPLYRAALERLHADGRIYPCSRSRRDVIEAAGAPHEGGPDDEPVYPASFRPDPGEPLAPLGERIGVNWRLRVPDGEELAFEDGRLGPQRAVAGRDFGDFPVWRKDDCPSYQLACAVDDAGHGDHGGGPGRGPGPLDLPPAPDLPGAGAHAPRFHHCPLMVDEAGVAAGEAPRRPEPAGAARARGDPGFPLLRLGGRGGGSRAARCPRRKRHLATRSRHLVIHRGAPEITPQMKRSILLLALLALPARSPRRDP